MLQYSSKRRIVDVFLCARLYLCSPGLMGSRWVDGWMCMHVCWTWEESTRRGQWEYWLCASHVKFMFCAAFTKEPWNGFWGKIMLKQWEDGPEDNEADEAESRGRGRREKDTRKGKVNVPSRRGKWKKNEDYPSGHSKGWLKSNWGSQTCLQQHHHPERDTDRMLPSLSHITNSQFWLSELLNLSNGAKAQSDKLSFSLSFPCPVNWKHAKMHRCRFSRGQCDHVLGVEKPERERVVTVALSPATLKFSRHYVEELYEWKQMSESLNRLHPACSSVQSPCNVWLSPCVNGAGHDDISIMWLVWNWKNKWSCQYSR